MRSLKFLLAAVVLICTTTNVNAATIDTQQKAALDLAISKATFATSPPTIDAANYIADPRIPQIPSFAWQANQPLAQAFPAAIAMLMGGNKYSPLTAIQAAGGDVTALQNAKLSRLPFLGKLPFAAAIDANPLLAHLKVGDVLPQWAKTPTNPADPTATLGTIANSPLGKSPIPADVLAATPAQNLPDILTTPYDRYPGIGKPDLPNIPSIDPNLRPLGTDGVKIADLPGIPNIPWNKLLSVQNIPASLQPMKFDKLLSGQEKLSPATGSNIASGSNKQPHAPCTGTCTAVELRSAIDSQNSINPLDGSLAVIGQKLMGGEGLLGDLMTVAGIREPAGFEVPYIGINGCGSKWSAESPDPQNGTIAQQLNLRFCYSLPLLGMQASPYFIPLRLPLPASEQGANALLPMVVTPVAMIQPPKLATVPTAPIIAQRSKSSGTSPSQQPFTSPASTRLDRVALFGSATKTAWSPVMGISSGDV
jgi:hypothetical protein